MSTSAVIIIVLTSTVFAFGMGALLGYATGRTDGANEVAEWVLRKRHSKE